MRNRWIGFFALAATLLLFACAPGSDSDVGQNTLSVAALLGHQRLNLTTDLISVPEQLGLARVGYGWQHESRDGAGDSWLTLTGQVGRLEIFSADGNLAEIEVELSTAGSRARPRPIRVRLNGKRLERLRPGRDWASYRVEVPPEIVRQGVNVLEIVRRKGRDGDGRQRQPKIRLRRLRARSLSGRPLWPQRPQEILSNGTITLPVSSFFDLTFSAPESAHLQGTYVFDTPDKSQIDPVYLYVQALDESGAEHTLFHKRFLKSQPRRQAMDLDLSDWAGQLLRLRIGITGSGNGIVRWQDLSLAADSPIEDLVSLPPIVRSDPERSGRMGRPDILVILLDAARADAFSPFGGPHPTPATERLATDGTVFREALSPAPWTGQSVPSTLTGLYPDTLHVGALGGHLPDEVPSLPELMAAAGYHTVLWSQHPFYRNHKSFRRGFEEIHQSPPGEYQSLPTAEVLLEEGRPTFAWVHLIPPHAPYRPPAPFYGTFSSWYSGPMSAAAENLSRYPHRDRTEDLTEDDVNFARNRYQENVVFADSLVARLLSELESRGRYRESLIVLLSDHGEAFLEHGIFLHTRNVHRELLHVPLVIKWPGSMSGYEPVVDVPVSLVDLVPTLVDGLEFKYDGDGFQGRSLLPPAFDHATDPRVLYALTRGVEDRRKAPKPALMLQSGHWRILHDPLLDASKLYQASEDPLETSNLASELPLQTLLLKQSALSQWHWNRQILRAPVREESSEELDPEVVEQLRALGYLN